MLKLNEKQLSDVLMHILGITKVLSDAGGVPPESESLESATGSYSEDLSHAIDALEACPFDRGCPPAAVEPQGSAYPVYPDRDEPERCKMDRIMNRLCGRWAAGGNRCGVEIVRRGDFLTLHYLKRNGAPQDERFVLMPFDDGCFIYYTHGERIVSVSHDAVTDTLMISPGVDYSRVAETDR
jgi:hypothetical protein